MILTHEDLSAIEQALGPVQAAPIINCLRKLEYEIEANRALFMEFNKSDVAALKTDVADLRTQIGTLRNEVERLRALVKLPG